MFIIKSESSKICKDLKTPKRTKKKHSTFLPLEYQRHCMLAALIAQAGSIFGDNNYFRYVIVEYEK